MAQVPASSRGSAGVTLLSYVEVTAALTVTATSAAAAQTFATSAAVTVDGGTIIVVETFIPRVDAGASASTILSLWQDSTDLGVIASVLGNAAGSPCLARRFLTPAAGSPVFTIRAYRANANGTLQAGSGTAGVTLPAYLRVTTAA